MIESWKSTNIENDTLNSYRAELLGNLLKYPNQYDRYSTTLQAEHFGELAFVYQAFVYAKKRDGELNHRAIMKDLGPEYFQLFATIRESVISEHRTDWLAVRVIKSKSTKDIIKLAERLLLEANHSDPHQLMNQLKDHLNTVMINEIKKLPDPTHDYDEFVSYVVSVKNDPSVNSGIMTSNPDLDSITNGWQRSDLIVIGGRTSMGKSAFALNNVLELAKNGYKCAVFSLEMSKRQVYMRLASNAYEIPLNAFKNGGLSDETIHRLQQKDSFWKNILIDDTRAVTADYIADTISEIKKQYGLDFVVVDYLQDIKEIGEHTDNTGSALSRICRKLRKAAQESNVSIMAMSQVSRDVEKRGADKRPSNSDLSGSTGIETSADVIGILYRDEYYNPDTEEQNVLELNITKHRNGALGQVKFFYDKSTQRIRPYAKKFDESTRPSKSTGTAKKTYE